MWYLNVVLVCFTIQLTILCIRDVQAKVEQHIWCGACIAMIEDMKIQISTVDKQKKLQVGSFRLDADGKQRIREVPYSTSDLYLMDELERICNAMHHYGETTSSNGEKIVIRTSSYDGTSISMKNVRKDSKLTSILQYACETIIEDHEDLILKILKTYHNEKAEVEKQICVTETKLCTEDELKTRMWTMAQAVMAGIQEKADERLYQSRLEQGEDQEEEEKDQSHVEKEVEDEELRDAISEPTLEEAQEGSDKITEKVEL